ncbi:hypothetical protein WJX84_008357 [Apatococcus fuscideae]|uniref:RNA helicase n=1 Tax=Apatococcus fuscideae TaxID=2026836 RepID=A0AAW1TII4_9CHLO
MPPGAGQLALPIYASHDAIIKAVRHHQIVVVEAPTGSGKTTQLPQMLLDAGLAGDRMIGVTQPRRVAAVTVARRVAEERDCRVGDEVGYAIRFDEHASSKTRIKYMTDGTLLRESLEDTRLSAYSVIILDEAHERSLNTDLLFGILKRLTTHKHRRKSLKLLITSATLEAAKVSAYFSGCPIQSISGRQYDVSVSHSLENHDNDYYQAAIDTAMQVHLHEAPGDILMFLTGQGEITKAVRQLNEAVSSLPADCECDALLVMPLYAAMPPDMQARIFAPCPEGCRRLIVATNVAETSITVSGIVYVIDPGRVKQKSYSPQTGLDALTVVPISRVQAVQRAGRAGRTQPGKCFRLYTQQYFDRDMPNITVPEIQRTSLLSACLYLKSLSNDIDVISFDYLDPPQPEALEDALRQLFILDAIDGQGEVTPLGSQMARLPLDPCLARMLIAAANLGCLPEALIVAAMLSADSIFAENRGPEQIARMDAQQLVQAGGITAAGQQLVKKLMEDGPGDHILLLRLYRAWQETGCNGNWCQAAGLNTRGMRFARDVEGQLEAAIENSNSTFFERALGDGSIGRAKKRRKTSHSSEIELRQAILIGFASRLAHRMPTHNGYKTLGERSVLAQLHPVTANIAADEDGLLPEWVVYHELIATSKNLLRKVCPVDATWVSFITPKIANADVNRLRGGHREQPSQGGRDIETVSVSAAEQAAAAVVPRPQAAVEAARARFLARKAGRL